MKTILQQFQVLGLLAAGTLLAPQGRAQNNVWTGGGGTNQNWSATTNWSLGVVPGATANVAFTNNVGSATNAGTVDNIVDSSFTNAIASLIFANTNTGGGAGFYHTTQIGAGQTLTVLGNLVVGNTPDFANSQTSATFTGAGTLVVSNTSGNLNISQGDTGNNALATLNMTNLNNFNATLAGITVGVYNTPNLTVARQKGQLFLARTNVITLSGSPPRAYGNESQLEIGENLGNGSNLQIPMYLGLANTINVNTITVGGDKQGSGTLFAFNPVFTNAQPMATFRGSAGGSSRVSTWKVGDNSNQTTTGSGCSGTVNFSNGSLDVMVDTLIIGEGESGATTGTGNGNGTFTFNAGTVNANTVYLGYRVATGGNSAPPGTLNVNGTGTLIANNAICLSYYVTNSGSTYGAGNLNVNGGTVLATAITNGVSGGANSTANVTVNGGTLGITSLSGVVGTVAAPIINLNLSNAVLQLQVSGFQTNISTVNLTLDGASNTVSFTYLPPVASYPVTNALIHFQSLPNALNFVLGSFPSASTAYQGYLTSDANDLYLILTNGPTIGSNVDIWTGANGSSWDLATVNWTSAGNPTTYVNGAPVQFDDTAINPSINLTASLLPASVTVSNNTLNYTFEGSGKISGSGSLTKDGAGMLLITNSTANDFLGNITINAGTVQFGNGGTAGVLPANGSVLDNGNLVFDRSGNVLLPNSISGTGTIVESGTSVLTVTASNSFSGTTVVSNGTLVLNGILSGTLSNAPGSTIGGTGTNTGTVTIGGLLQPSASTGVPTTFTTGGTLNVSPGAALAFDLNATNPTPGDGINDLLNVGGDLDVSTNVISLNFQGVPQSGATYQLINFNGTQNGLFNSTLGGTHFAATLNQGVSPISVTLNGSGANLKWDSISNNLWNIGVNTNWLNLGTASLDVFYQGDNVLLDDSVPGVVSNITIPAGAAVSPTTITNNSSSVNYAIAGPGQINGNVTLVKLGSSTLTISSPNPGFTGLASVQGGTLRVGNTQAFGASGTVAATNGGTLDLNGAGIGEVVVMAAGSGVNGNGAIINNGTDQIHAVNTVKLSGDAVFGGTGRWDIRINGTTSASLSTSDSVTHNLVKKGTNLVALVTCTIDPSIGDIDIQAGSFSLELAGTSQNSSAWFDDTNRSITVESGADLDFNTLGSAFPLYRTIVLNDGSLVTSTAGDNGIGGSVVLQGNDTITVNGGSAPWLQISGVISGTGNLIVNGPLPLELSGSNTYTGNTLVNAGKLMLVGDGSIFASSNIVLAANTLLDASLRSDQTVTLSAGQTLQGNGGINGMLTVGPGATVSAGTNSINPGLLTVSNTVTLQGNCLLKLKPGAGTNDIINVVNGAGINLGGTLTVANVGGSFAVGNSFTLFNAVSFTGGFTTISPATPGPGLVWNTNNLASGILAVNAGAQMPQPVITSVFLSGSNLVVTGTNGIVGEQFNLLTSTNLNTPLSNWTVLTTNTFSAGSFTITNLVNPNFPASFYLLRIP